MTTQPDDDILSDTFHGCALLAYVEVRRLP